MKNHTQKVNFIALFVGEESAVAGKGKRGVA